MPRRLPTPAVAAIFGLMVLAWAGNYLFVRLGESAATPLWLATLRAAVGAAGVLVYQAVRPPSAQLSNRGRRDALLLGIPNTAVFLGLWFAAAPAIAPGETAVVVYTFPLWVALFSPWMLGRPLHRPHGVAIGLGFAGVVLVSEPWQAAGAGPTPLALLELLVAAVSWAAATVAFQRRFPASELAAANAYQLLGGAAALLVAALVLDPARWPQPGPVLGVSVVWLGLFGTAFAYIVWFYLLESIPAHTLSGYSFLVPLGALGLSVILEGERLSPTQLAGVALVLAGTYLVARVAGPEPAGGHDGLSRAPIAKG